MPISFAIVAFPSPLIVVCLQRRSLSCWIPFHMPDIELCSFSQQDICSPGKDLALTKFSFIIFHHKFYRGVWRRQNALFGSQSACRGIIRLTSSRQYNSGIFSEVRSITILWMYFLCIHNLNCVWIPYPSFTDTLTCCVCFVFFTVGFDAHRCLHWPHKSNFLKSYKRLHKSHHVSSK